MKDVHSQNTRAPSLLRNSAQAMAMDAAMITLELDTAIAQTNFLISVLTGLATVIRDVTALMRILQRCPLLLVVHLELTQDASTLTFQNQPDTILQHLSVYRAGAIIRDFIHK